MFIWASSMLWEGLDWQLTIIECLSGDKYHDPEWFTEQFVAIPCQPLCLYVMWRLDRLSGYWLRIVELQPCCWLRDIHIATRSFQEDKTGQPGNKGWSLASNSYSVYEWTRRCFITSQLVQQVWSFELNAIVLRRIPTQDRFRGVYTTHYKKWIE